MSDLQFPAKLAPVFEPHRYKVIHGGRGGAKSWGVARALLIQGAQQKLRILCAREIQKSIKDSVHKLLADQIEMMGLQSRYQVFDNEIRGINGTEFLFSGLASHTITSIKSYEGIDKCWVEEAQAVSKRSWDILIPTIRKEGSEIWITFNPELDTDETWVRFVVAPPPDSVVIQLNFSDNPWFPDTLEAERKHCLATSPEEYANIWGGYCRASVAGAIYAKEVSQIITENRYGPCPYDPKLKVHTIWDLGWNDAMAIGLVQRARSECRFIAYYEGSFKRTDEWANELNKLPYNWGYDYLPFDGFQTTRHAGLSDYQILRRAGRKVKGPTEAVPKLNPEVGIRAARGLLARSYFNKGGHGIDRLMECIKRYRRSVPANTNEPASPLHDEYSHGADMIRHCALVIDKLKNDDERDYTRPVVRRFRPVDSGMGALG